MPLLSESDRRAASASLGDLTRPVTLVLFTQTFAAPESALVAKQILDEAASLSSMISVEEANFVLDKQRAAEFGVDRIPSVVVLAQGSDTRIRFIGAPSGYEFASLLEAVRLAGSGDSGLSPESRALVAAHATTPIDVKVFVTPTCHFCPRVVTLAHRLAIESPHVTATCVEATEFMDLARKYRVTGVPKTVVNDQVELLGAVPEDEFVRAVLGLDQAESRQN
jgi:glutaredoxin-like protein